jgi:hypothetical protein
MAETKPFSIEISEPYTEESFLAPEDPLGELPVEELNFRKFCFDQNHLVTVRVDGKQKTVFLFPDVALTFPQLLDIPHQLRQGFEASVSFPERPFWLTLKPESTGVECRLEEFGYRPGSTVCMSSLEDVVRSITEFADDVLARAVDAGYLIGAYAVHEANPGKG